MAEDSSLLTAPFRELFELSPDAILVFLEGVVTHANPAAVQLLRARSTEDLVGRASRDLIARQDIPGVASRARQIMMGAVRTTQAEERYLRLDGTTVVVEAHASRASFYNGKAFIVLLRDITGRKAAEDLEHRLNAQKMDGVGRLAGGVAHGFNNLLTIILESADHLATQVQDPDGDLDRIRDAAGRAATLTQQLLAVAHQAPASPRVAALDDLILQIAGPLRPILGDRIALETDLQAQGALANIDPGQLELVVTNAALNARDSMANGGTLLLSTRARTASLGAGMTPVPCVVLEMTDTRTGMDEATRRRAFEPFFTTKPKAVNSGLGLSTSYGIVAQSGGHIEIDSEVGRGTCVRVFFPRCASLGVDEADRVPASDRSGRVTVLLLEDEPAVRRATARMLRSLGYLVLDAAMPSEALALARSHPGVIDALVTDVVMPEMNGPEAAAAFRSVRPAAAVLYVSGYSHEVLSRSPGVKGIRLLSKPFTKGQLESALKDAIARSGG
jgi:PAS domain S-box-containing protein